MLWNFIRWLFANHWPLVVAGALMGLVAGAILLALTGATGVVIGLGLAALVGTEATLLEAFGIGIAFLMLVHLLTAALFR